MENSIKPQRGRSDFREIKAPMHGQAAWIGGRGREAEKKRQQVSTRAVKAAATARRIAPLAVDIFAELLPDTTEMQKEMKDEQEYLEKPCSPDHCAGNPGGGNRR